MRDFEYDVHPGVSMVQKWLTELPSKTGRSVGQWIDLVKKAGPATEAERRAWLKAEHGFGTIGAAWIAERCEGKGAEDDTPESNLKAAKAWVEAMFSGKKAGLRPIYDHLLPIVKGLGSDVKICPGKTIVPIYRQHVFAQIKPATNTRIDLGFAFGDMPAVPPLIDTGGYAKKDRITHRIPLGTVSDINDDVLNWLKRAYDKDV